MALGKSCCLLVAFLVVALQTSNAVPVKDVNWSETKNACIKNNNIKILEEVLTIDACKEMCVKELGTLCRSIDYNSKDQKCNLSILKSDSVYYTEPCYNNQPWIYTERKVDHDENWSVIKNACIKEHNFKKLEEVPTIAACKEMCVNEKGTLCRSIDYNPKTQKCNLSELKSDSAAYTEPCYNNQTWVYTERKIDLACPAPFKMRGDECFFITEGDIEPLNWDDSRQKCLDMGADLAMPHDMVDFVQYIKESYPDSKSTIWLGATDREVEQEWKWVSREPVLAEMWKPWPHNQPSGDGNCMEIHYWPATDFYMNDWHCNNKGHYACEKHIPPPPPPPAPSCPAPYKMRGNECIFISEDFNELLNWDDSREKCWGMGGDLAEPHDMVDFVQYIKESYPESSAVGTIWLGATDREVEQEWKWLSGGSVPAEMWEGWPGKQPSGDGNCMEIHWREKQDFYMNDWYCQRQGLYACEFDMCGK